MQVLMVRAVTLAALFTTLAPGGSTATFAKLALFVRQGGGRDQTPAAEPTGGTPVDRGAFGQFLSPVPDP